VRSAGQRILLESIHACYADRGAPMTTGFGRRFIPEKRQADEPVFRSKKNFATPLRNANREPILKSPDVPDAPWQMSTAQQVAPGRDGFRGVRCGCLFAAVNASPALRRAKGRRNGSVRMPSGGCQRIEEGLARPEIASLFCWVAESLGFWVPRCPVTQQLSDPATPRW
jgi:hypothetical protein